MDEKREKDLRRQPPETEPQKKEAVPGGVSAVGAVTASGTDEQGIPLLPDEETKDFRVRWDAIQVGFVDDPRRAVEQADGLVVMVFPKDWARDHPLRASVFSIAGSSLINEIKILIY